MIYERLNGFFVNIGNSFSRSIAVVNKSPTKYMGERLLCSIYRDPVLPQQLDEITKSLKNGTPGSDGITAQIIKTISQSMNGPSCYLCNRSLTEGVFPDELKIVNVLPLFKSGDPLLSNNCRPVSLYSNTFDMLFGKHRSKYMDAKITIDGHEIDQGVKTKF